MDNAMWYMTMFLLCTKGEALEVYQKYESWAVTQQHCQGIKVLRSDCGGEYLSKVFNEHLQKAGTARKLTTYDTPQHNGIMEHLNCTLLECICALMHKRGLPRALWGKALRHSTWLKNRTATQALDGKTPFETLYGLPPDLSMLRMWGCPVWVHAVDHLKLSPHMCEAHWLRPDINACAHCIFWPVSQTIGVKQNVYFGTSAQLEGEEGSMDIPNSEQTAVPPSPSTASSPDLPNTPSITETSSSASMSQHKQQAVPPTELHCSTRMHKPSCTICDIQSGIGVMPTHSSSRQSTPSTQMPGMLAEDIKEAGGVWAVIPSEKCVDVSRCHRAFS